MRDPRSLLTHLWTAGVRSVGGREAVAAALERDGPLAASLVVAAGKAACSMFEGAAPCLSAATRSIVVSKHGHIDPGFRARPGMEIIEAGHPLPDANSLVAGERVLRAVSEAGSDDRLLLLISGGASATVEALQPGLDLDELQAVTSSLLGSGQSIHQINDIRSRMSRIKGGRLLASLPRNSPRSRPPLMRDMRERMSLIW